MTLRSCCLHTHTHTRTHAAYAVEYFVLNVSTHHEQAKVFGENCGYSTHNCRADHYHVECPRSGYIGKIEDYASQHPLPPSSEATIDRSSKWAKNNCRPLYAAAAAAAASSSSAAAAATANVPHRYMDQSWWGDWGAFPLKRPQRQIPPLSRTLPSAS